MKEQALVFAGNISNGMNIYRLNQVFFYKQSMVYKIQLEAGATINGLLM